MKFKLFLNMIILAILSLCSSISFTMDWGSGSWGCDGVHVPGYGIVKPEDEQKYAAPTPHQMAVITQTGGAVLPESHVMPSAYRPPVCWTSRPTAHAHADTFGDSDSEDEPMDTRNGRNLDFDEDLSFETCCFEEAETGLRDTYSTQACLTPATIASFNMDLPPRSPEVEIPKKGWRDKFKPIVIHRRPKKIVLPQQEDMPTAKAHKISDALRTPQPKRAPVVTTTRPVCIPGKPKDKNVAYIPIRYIAELMQAGLIRKKTYEWSETFEEDRPLQAIADYDYQ